MVRRTHKTCKRGYLRGGEWELGLEVIKEDLGSFLMQYTHVSRDCKTKNALKKKIFVLIDNLEVAEKFEGENLKLTCVYNPGILQLKFRYIFLLWLNIFN